MVNWLSAESDVFAPGHTFCCAKRSSSITGVDYSSSSITGVDVQVEQNRSLGGVRGDLWRPVSMANL